MALTYSLTDPTTHSHNDWPNGQSLPKLWCGKFKGKTTDICCCDGKVILQTFPKLPPLLQDLFLWTRTTQESTSYPRLESTMEACYNKLWPQENSIHAMAGTRGQDLRPNLPQDWYLLPPEEGQPKFLQVYFLDSMAEEKAARNRGNLNPRILEIHTTWFHRENHYYHKLKTALDVISKEAMVKTGKLSSGKTRGPRASIFGTTTHLQLRRPSLWTVYNQALCSLDDKVAMMDGKSLQVYGLPAPE